MNTSSSSHPDAMPVSHDRYAQKYWKYELTPDGQRIVKLTNAAIELAYGEPVGTGEIEKTEFSARHDAWQRFANSKEGSNEQEDAQVVLESFRGP